MLTKYKIVLFCPYYFVHTILSNAILSVYHFVHTILSVPFCPLPFCPVTQPALWAAFLGLAGSLDIMRDVLHWLPYPQRIVYRISALVRRCMEGLAPFYLRELCCSTVTIQRRISLRSSAQAE